ncbi:5'-deoxynucleotidase [Lachnospiraceae bacterium C1.1]|nr:5'-deoxynucleotidase [Lachnospiraceae bacterium C1.1]
MDYAFFAILYRLRWIDRWALMRNSDNENLSEHSLEVAMLSHALATIGNKKLGKTLNAEKAALFGIYHDASEILTGDMPTPVKYFNDEIANAYKDIEKNACERLISLLPDYLKDSYKELMMPGDEYSYEKKLVKGADKLSAYIKCLNEKKAGNMEFAQAEKSTLQSLHKLDLEEVELFLKDFIPAYRKTLDEIKV